MQLTIAQMSGTDQATLEASLSDAILFASLSQVAKEAAMSLLMAKLEGKYPELIFWITLLPSGKFRVHVARKD